MRVQNLSTINQSLLKKSPNFKDRLNIDTPKIIIPKNQLPQLSGIKALGHKILISRHLKTATKAQENVDKINRRAKNFLANAQNDVKEMVEDIKIKAEICKQEATSTSMQYDETTYQIASFPNEESFTFSNKTGKLTSYTIKEDHGEPDYVLTTIDFNDWSLKATGRYKNPVRYTRDSYIGRGKKGVREEVILDGGKIISTQKAIIEKDVPVCENVEFYRYNNGQLVLASFDTILPIHPKINPSIKYAYFKNGQMVSFRKEHFINDFDPELKTASEYYYDSQGNVKTIAVTDTDTPFSTKTGKIFAPKVYELSNTGNVLYEDATLDDNGNVAFYIKGYLIQKNISN